jgi:hypothetical protein
VQRRVALACLTFAALACGRPRGEPSGVYVDPRIEPKQTELSPSDAQELARSMYDTAVFEPKARYRIAARVLSRERYYLGWSADLAPVDLALGWGELSDPAIDDVVDWYQGARWYFWKWDEQSTFDNGDIARQSANVHIVPATQNLRRALLAIKEDDIVQLSGFLVNIEGPEGQRWRSSLKRTDTGGGSCELLYATELIRRERVYR